MKSSGANAVVRRRSRSRHSAVGQKVFPDVVAVGLEQRPRAAVVADLLVGPLDHAMAFAGEGREHLTGAGDLEALFCARLGLHLGHLALLFGGRGPWARAPPRWRSKPSVLEMSFHAATAAL